MNEKNFAENFTVTLQNVLHFFVIKLKNIYHGNLSLEH